MSTPRLCHIVKWPHFDGYGFDLHAEKGKGGGGGGGATHTQYIGKVDDGSPAQAAGLRQGDRIVEVNGAPIAGKTHKEVVELIKAVPGETKLLVVDNIDSTTTTTTPPPPPSKIESNGRTKQEEAEEQQQQHPVISMNGGAKKKMEEEEAEEETATPQQQQQQQQTKNGMHLNMTAAEMRARLAERKKFDPKKESMDFKKKFDIIQNM